MSQSSIKLLTTIVSFYRVLPCYISMYLFCFRYLEANVMMLPFHHLKKKFLSHGDSIRQDHSTDYFEIIRTVNRGETNSPIALIYLFITPENRPVYKTCHFNTNPLWCFRFWDYVLAVISYEFKFIDTFFEGWKFPCIKVFRLFYNI